MADRPVVLVWAKRIWRCLDPDCPVTTWSEEVDEIAPRAALTERARAEICRRVGRDGHSVAEVARAFGVGWHTAMAAVRDHGRPRVDHLSRLGAPTAVGLDEHSFLSGTVQHPTLLVTGFVDLDRHRLLDVVEGRTAQGVSDWLAARPAPWLAAIGTVTLDPYAGYARAWPMGCRTPNWSSITSTPCAWPMRPWTRSAVGSSKSPWATGAARASRSIGSAASCSSLTSG
jgi:transposase